MRVMTLIVATAALELFAADPFCNEAVWPEKSAHADAVSLTFGGLYRGEPSLVVSNCIGRSFDTAWRVASACRRVPDEARFLRVAFRAAADWVIRETYTTPNWCNAISWYDADGRQLARKVQRSMTIGRVFSRLAYLDERPKGAVTCRVEFRFDTPNVPPDLRIALNSLTCRFFAERPADEPTAALDLCEPAIRFTPPANASDGFSFVATDVSGVDWKSLAVRVDGAEAPGTLTRRGDRVAFARSGGVWANGLHKVTIRVKDALENEAASDRFFRIGPGGVRTPVCRLRKDGMALVDGQPFFPIGVYGVSRREFNGFDFDRACADLKAGGFNIVHSYSEYDNPAFFAAARRNGLRTWCEFSTPEAKPFADFQFADASCIARYTGDDTATYFSPSTMLDRHENVRLVDGGRLTCQADSLFGKDPSVSRYRDYVHSTDVFMPEIYPIMADTPENASNCVAIVIRDMDRARLDIAEAHDASPHGLWPIIQYFQGWENWKRFPTRDELMAMSFASIVHGANGLTLYTYGGRVNPQLKEFNYGVTTTPERWANTTNLATRVAFLSPALLSETGGRCDPKVAAGPKSDPLGHPSVTALWKRLGDEVYVIAVNATLGTCEAAFDLAAAGVRAGKAEVLWEDRGLAVSNGGLADRFGPFAVHVYRLSRR